MDDINRLKQLAGIRENTDVLSDEEADEMKEREWEARNRLEKKMQQVISKTFQRVGISVRESDYGSFGEVLFEADTGEATVYIDECTAAQIAALNNSGLAADYSITATSDLAIRIEFTVDPRVVDNFRG